MSSFPPKGSDPETEAIRAALEKIFGDNVAFVLLVSRASAATNGIMAVEMLSNIEAHVVPYLLRGALGKIEHDLKHKP